MRTAAEIKLSEREKTGQDQPGSAAKQVGAGPWRGVESVAVIADPFPAHRNVSLPLTLSVTARSKSLGRVG